MAMEWKWNACIHVDVPDQGSDQAKQTWDEVHQQGALGCTDGWGFGKAVQGAVASAQHIGE